MKVLTATEDGEMALTVIQQLAPDVALLDMDMLQIDGIEVARTHRQKA
jgi:CheY-like chemotaxis protein